MLTLRGTKSGVARHACAVIALLMCVQVSALSGIVALLPGFNLVGIPLDPARTPTLAALLGLLGGPDSVRSVARLDAETGQLEECRYDDLGEPQGAACEQAVSAGDAWLVDAIEPIEIPYDVDVACPLYDLDPGTHLRSLPCIVPDLSSYDVLNGLGDARGLRSIQTFDAAAGRWQSAAASAQGAVGINFPIAADKAYLLGVDRPLLLGAPRADAGPDKVALLGTPARLDGSNSGAVTFFWTLTEVPDGSNAALSNPAIADPELVPDVDGTYIAELTVTDTLFTSALSDTDTALVFGLVPENDHDNDGLSNADEINIHGTDPLDADTDGDFFPDGVEVEFGGDPTDPTIKPKFFVTSAPPTAILRIGRDDSRGLPLNTMIASPAVSTLLRIGQGDPGALALNTALASPAASVLRPSNDEPGALLFNTAIASPSRLSVLRIGKGDANTRLPLNVTVANPAAVTALRLGRNSEDSLPLNTVIANPALTRVLRPTTGEQGRLELNTTIARPPISVQIEPDPDQ